MIKLLLIIICIPSIAIAGRHSIARGEATKIVNARFEEFYRNEARRKQEEQAAMEREIVKAKILASSMLANSQQQHHNSKIVTADELMKNMAMDINPNIASYVSSATMAQDITAANKQNNPLLLLKSLENSRPAAKQAAITEILQSVQGLPNSEELITNFAKDLVNISPEMASQLTAQNVANNLKDASRGLSNPNNASKATSNTEVSKSLLQLKNLEQATPTARTAAIKQLINDLQALPNEELLAITKDLANISPTISTEFATLLNQAEVKPAINNSATFFDVKSGTKETNPFLFLQSLEHATPEERAAGILDVVDSLPDDPELITEFSKDLHKIAPTIATELNDCYKVSANAIKLSLLPNKGVTTSSAAGNLANVTTIFAQEKPEILTANNTQLEHKPGLNYLPSTASSNKQLSSGNNINKARDKKVTTKNFIGHKNNSVNSATDALQSASINNKLTVNEQLLSNKLNPRLTTKANIKFAKTADTFNAITTYNFTNNNLYKIYTAPYKVTTISFAPNEIIANSICGDSVRWKINTIINKVGGVRHQYLTVQPLRSDLTTSITITTNQGRLYVLEATSLANNYMAVVRWNYAED